MVYLFSNNEGRNARTFSTWNALFSSFNLIAISTSIDFSGAHHRHNIHSSHTFLQILPMLGKLPCKSTSGTRFSITHPLITLAEFPELPCLATRHHLLQKWGCMYNSSTNPFVTPEITLKVASRLRETIIKNYYRDLRQLKRKVSFVGVEVLLLIDTTARS